MTTFENLLTFVRSIKGAPASVLWALVFTRHPMTNQELQRWTGYSPDSITRATQVLLDLGWLVALSPYGPWALAPGRQLPLMEMPSVSAESLPSGSDILGTPLSSSSIVDDPTPQVTEEETKEQNDPQKTAPPEDVEDENFVKTVQALYDAGIREPTAGRLARLPHVNPEYVAAHVEQANAQGFQLGTAIYRIEHGWPLPDRKAVLTVDDKIKKFLSDEPRRSRHKHPHSGAHGP